MESLSVLAVSSVHWREILSLPTQWEMSSECTTGLAVSLAPLHRLLRSATPTPRAVWERIPKDLVVWWDRMTARSTLLFWDEDTSGISDGDYGQPRSTAEFDDDDFGGWDFNQTWQIGTAPDGMTRPIFQWQ